MFIGSKTISWIEGTPLGISVYSVNYLSMQMHPNILEIIYCLEGSVKFSYAYEEFTLNKGEFISVDKDAYYLYEGKENICVSFYFDLTKYEKKYPYITTTYFVCEGLKEGTMPYPTRHHDQLRGMLISLLKYINDPEDYCHDHMNTINKVVEKVVKLFINHFNIVFFYTGGTEIKEDMMERFHHINMYLQKNLQKDITINDIAGKFKLSDG